MPLHSDIKHCCILLQSYLYLDEQLDDLSPGLRGQVIEVGKDSAHDETVKKSDETSYPEANIIQDSFSFTQRIC